MRRLTRRFARRMVCLAVFGLLTGVGCAPAPEQVTGELSVGRVVDVPFSLESPRYVRYRLTTHRVAMRLTVLAPDGKVLAESRGGEDMTERVVALTAPSGRHVARVEGVSGHGEDTFTLQRAEDRPPRPEDARRAETWATLQGITENLPTVAAGEASTIEETFARIDHLGAVFEELADTGGQAAARKVEADLHYWMGSYDAARKAYKAGLGLLGRLRGDPRLRAEYLTQIADSLTSEGLKEKAMSAYDRAIAAWDRVGDPWGRLDAENSRAVLLFGKDQLDAAQRELEEVLVQRRKLGDREGEAVTLASLGPVYRQKLAIAKAFSAYEEAFKIGRELEIAWLETMNLYNLGVAYRALGELQPAFRHQKEALAASRNHPSLTPDILKELALVLRRLGRPAEALEYLEENLASVQAAGPDARGKLFQTMGWIQLDLQQAQAAAESFDRALEAFSAAEESSRDVSQIAITRSGLARALRELGRPPALENITAAVDALADGRYSGYTFGLLELAEAQRSVGDWDASTVSWKEARKRSHLNGSTAYESEALLGWARTARDRGDRREALARVTEAIDLDERARLELGSDFIRGSHLARGQEAYDLQLELLWDRFEKTREPAVSARAWALHERRKGRMLLDRLEGTKSEGLSDEELDERGRITDRLTAARRELVEAQESGSDKTASKLRQEVRGLGFELLAFERRRADGGARRSESVGLDQLQKRLAAGEAVVEYALGDERSFVFVVTRDRLGFHELPVTDSKVGKRVGQYLEALRNSGRRAAENLPIHGDGLSKLLLEPIRDDLTGATRLIVVPDRSLWRLPFDSLPWDGRRALDRWSFVFASSSTVWTRLLEAEPSRCSDRVVAFADPDRKDWKPLPQARQEVAGLGALTFVGTEASEHAVKTRDEVRRACRLHFATHAGVRSDSGGIFSGLVLAAGEGEDGDLEVHEIAELPLRANLVVLSACESGLGESMRGEGFVGFTQGFFTAGAKNLVVSLWPVDDDAATVKLMADFHAALGKGLSPGAALHRAKLQAAPEDTAAWSAFVLVGRG